MEATKNKRRVWTREETRCLLSFYRKRREEFNRSRKKKFAYANLVEDLTSSGVLKSPVTPGQIENKVKSFARAYNSMPKNETKPYMGPHKARRKSGIGPTTSTGIVPGTSFPVFDERTDSPSSAGTDITSESSTENVGSERTPVPSKKRKSKGKIFGDLKQIEIDKKQRREEKKLRKDKKQETMIKALEERKRSQEAKEKEGNLRIEKLQLTHSIFDSLI